MRCLALICLAAAAVALDAPAIQRVPGDAVLAWVQIPDPQRLIDHLEAAAGRFGDAGGDAPLAQALGRVLGEQELAALKPGAPIALLVLAPKAANQPPVAAWFVPAKDPAVLQQAAPRLRQRGVAVVEDVVVFARTQVDVDRAVAEIATYDALAAAPTTGDVRVHVSIARALATWGPMARMGIESIAAMAGMADPDNGPATAAILKLELHALMRLLEQIDDVQLDASTDADALSLRWSTGAKPDTPLAAFLARQPSTAPAAPRLLAAGPTMMAMSLQMDGGTMTALMRDLLEHLAAQPATQAMLTPEIRAAVEPVLAGWGGDMAFRATTGADGTMRMETVADASDPALGRALADAFAAFLGEGSAIGQLYAKMGIRYQVTPDARERDGVAVHRLFMDQGEAKPDAARDRFLQQFMLDTEFAVAHGWYVSSAPPAGLDGLLDAAQAAAGGALPAAGLALRAERTHGPGRGMYVDYDLVELVRLVTRQIAPGLEVEGDDHEPLTIAAHWADGISASDVRVPYAPIVAIIQGLEDAHGGAVPRPQPVPADDAPTF